MKLNGIVLGLLALAACGTSRADVRVPAIFGDHMVLPAGTNTPVWGWAEPGETVTVKTGQAIATTTAGPNGQWKVTFTDLQTSSTPVTVSVAGKNTLTFQDVLIGDVWVCSGQSNMALPLRRVLGRDASGTNGLGQARHPQLRLFAMKKCGALEPRADCAGRWAVCTPEAAREFSATAYFFGREVQQAERIPIGLIGANRGSTCAEYWTSLEALQAEPALTNYVRQAQAARARAAGPVAAGADLTEDKAVSAPALLFNAMIHPLIPFGIKGVIWYQGEGNSDQALLYRTLFPALIRDWRTRWGRGDFPFYFVQLPNFGAAKEQPDDDSNWPPLREAQLLTLKSAINTGMAIAIDIGEANNIHPTNKKEVGRRLALLALANTYGRPIDYSGPLYDRMELQGGKVRIYFTHVGAGLAAKGGGALKRFAIAGADKKFVWADAKIEPSTSSGQAADTVVVSSTQVPSPAAVRYAWADNPEGCNLYNTAGLPASPFRTDDWPLP